MKPTQYDADIRQTISNIAGERNHLKTLLDMRAEELCPFKIGDHLMNVNNDELAVVHAIKGSRYLSGYELYIKKIKNNGELYKNSTRVYSPQSEGWIEK